jgi:hypothetical protein
VSFTQLLQGEQLEELLAGLAALSFATFVISLVLIPWLIGRLPEECFKALADRQEKPWQASPIGLLRFVLRNILGFFLLVAGFLMLFLPGQGLLTLLIGLSLLTFPGKRRLLLFAVRGKRTREALDWLRRKVGKPPFHWPVPDDRGKERPGG